MFRVIFGVGAITIVGLYFVSKYAREKLEQRENPLQ